MLFKSQILTQASGSVGGLTFSHAPSGMYTRARAIPTDPATVLQISVRSAVSALVNRWNDVLTQAQRDAWDVYASGVPGLNALGSAFNQSGQNAYVQSNTPRLQAAATVYSPLTNLPLLTTAAAAVDTAPGTFDRGEGPVGLFLSAVDGIGATVDVAFDIAQAWLDEDDAVMLVWLSRPRSASRRFFKGPYRLVGAVEGDGITPPTSPATFSMIAPSYIAAVGQTVRVSAAVLRADGRTSAQVASNDAISAGV